MATTPSRPPRAEGQWALDGPAPLNPNEEFKAADNGLHVRQRIENQYARDGFDSIPAEDLHGRMRWWGLYTQRRQGIDGSRTAELTPEELSDRYFMMRVRLDGGALTTAQVRVLGEISNDFARGTADITDRQNLQYHWIAIEDVTEIWRRLEAAGMQTTEACGDTPRVILGSPVAGISADEIIDPTPVINQIVERFIGDESLSNLPRKFKSAITGHPSLDVVHEINDVSLVGVVHPDLGPGYDLWVGGGLSVAPRLAQRLGAFVTAEQAPEVWHGVIQIFRDYGYRRLRNRARLKFLVADWGTARFRSVLESEYLKRALVDGPEVVLPEHPIDHVGVHRQADGRYFVGVAPIAGRVSGAVLAQVADIAERHGSGRVRLTPYQKLLVLDIGQSEVEGVLAELRSLGLLADPSVWRRGTMACTGIEFCKLAIVETKARAAQVVAHLEERLGDLDTEITINVNGCPNACARTQVADIGLKGQLVPGPGGELVEGFQIHLGGGLSMRAGQDAGFGRKLRGLKTTAEELPAYVERVTRHYLAGRTTGETFAEWVVRADERQLQ